MKKTSIPRSEYISSRKTSGFVKTVKRAVQNVLLGGAIFGAAWGGVAEKAHAQAIAVDSWKGSFSPDEKAAIERAVNYVNEVVEKNTHTIFTRTINITAEKGNTGSGVASMSSGWMDWFRTLTVSNVVSNTNKNTQITTMGDGSLNLERVVIHEFGHALGIESRAYEAILTSGISFLGSIVPTYGTVYDEFVFYKGDRVNVIENYSYPGGNDAYTFRFAGLIPISATTMIYSDLFTASSISYLPIENGQTIGSGSFEKGSSISHPVSPLGNMNAVGSNLERPFFSAVELAVLSDIGNTINISKFFGNSYYQTHSGVITNVLGFDETSTYGVGLHLVAGGNTIVQDADLKSNGRDGAGIRIENTKNIVTIVNTTTPNDPASRLIQANGEDGIGVLIIHGPDTRTTNGYVDYSVNDKGTILINRGTIEAKGVNGTGVWFNTNAERFDNSGTIDVGTGNNAIYIGKYDTLDKGENYVTKGAVVKEINLMGNSRIIGDITNDGDYATLLTFGKAYDPITGEAKSVGDPGYNGVHNGDVIGKFKLESWGKELTLLGLEYHFTDGVLGLTGVDTTVNIRNFAEYDTLKINNIEGSASGSILNGADTIGKNSGRVTVNRSVENHGTILRLASFESAFIDNFNTTRDNTMVKTTASFWDTDLNVGIKNQVSGEIKNNTTIESEFALRNLGQIENNGTIDINYHIDNQTGAVITKTNTVLRGWNLNNDGMISETAKIDVHNIGNTGLIDDTSKMIVATNVENKAGGQIINTSTMTVGVKIDNLGLIDTANLVEAGGNIENTALIQNVVTLYSKTDIVNKTGAVIVDDQTVKADRDVSNDGTIDRFKTLEAGRDIRNTANGYVNVEQASTMTAGRDAFNSGLIRANGTVNVTNQMTNQADGILVGAGQITTTAGLLNNGTISVGNVPGFGAGKAIDTLEVIGPYVNNATGKILADVDPSHYPSNPFAGLHNDLIDVDGAGTVNGGEVFVNAPSNDKSVNATPARYVGNTKYTFLDTTAGLTVNTKMTANDPVDLLLFDFLADHDGKSYWLDVQREYYYGPFGDTYNQVSVGNYIDEIGLDPDPLGDFFGVLVELDKLNKNAGIAHRTGISDAAKHALDQMSGAIYGTIGTASVTNTTLVNNTLFDVLRRDSFGGGMLGCDPCESLCGRRAAKKRNAWGLGYGMGGRTEFDENAYGYDQSFGGTLLGIDHNFKRQTRWGVYVSYGEGRISSDLIEKSKSHEFLGGIYFRKDMKVGYFLASGGYGCNRYKTERTISFMDRKAKNKHDAQVGTVSLERGLEFEGKLGKLQPFFGLQYVANQQNGFTEKGADSLNLVGDITTAYSFRSMLGTRIDLNPVTVFGGKLSLEGNAIWMHEFLSRTHTNFTAQFSNPGMSNFSSAAKYMVKGNTPNRDWGIAGIGLNYERKRIRLFGGYDLFINQHQELHTGNAGLAYGW